MANFLEIISTFCDTILQYFGFGSGSTNNNINIGNPNVYSSGYDIMEKSKMEYKHNRLLEQSKTQCVELKSIMNYEEEFMSNLKQLQDLEPFLQANLENLVVEQEDRIIEIKKLLLEFSDHKRIAAQFPHDKELSEVTKFYRDTLKASRKTIDTYQNIINETKLELTKIPQKLQDLRHLFEFQHSSNTRLENELKNFQSNYKHLLTSHSNQNQSYPLEALQCHEFRARLNMLNKYVFNRNEHLVHFRDILRSEQDALIRMKNRKFFNRNFQLKPQATQLFCDNYIKNLRRLNKNPKLGLKQILEFELKKPNTLINALMASKIKFYKLYYGDLYSDIESFPEVLKSKLGQSSKDSLGTLFDGFYSEIIYSKEIQKRDKTRILHMFFIFRSGVLKSLTEQLTATQLFNMTKDETLCYKIAEKIFSEHQAHCASFFSIFHAAKSNNLPTDIEMEKFKRTFLDMLELSQSI